MATAAFVHLRVHTAYSLSQGAIRIKDLVKLCLAERMPAVAITDTSNLFGAMDFSVAMSAAGVQPIIGCQLSLSLAEGHQRRPRRGDLNADAIVLLVQNERGYRSLLKLLARAYDAAMGEAGCPLVSLADLEEHNEGLIMLSGGAAGPIGRLFLDGKEAQAEALTARLSRLFPDRLYIEIQRHGLESEALTEPLFLAMAERLSLPVVATNEAFFPSADMYEAHDALLCIAEGASLADHERVRLTVEHAFKGASEMQALFSDLPEAVANTLLIAKRCAFMIEPTKPILPPFTSDDGRPETEALREAARRGLEDRLAAMAETDPAGLAARTAAAYHERLNYELDVICAMGFAGYFLIVAEFIRWAKAEGIPVGPGRGSGAGSVVAWALTITDLDPLRFGLLFERFLNPERVSMPDFDIDFCQERRDEVIRHVRDRYGRDRVGQIITFGKLQARAVLRDVGRVMGLPFGQVDKICKLVPNNPAQPVKLAQAIEGEPQLQAMIAEDEAVARLVEIARKLEGLYRHASTHAAGIVIGDRPLDELIPLFRDPRSDLLVTGFDMKWVEQAGLVKFDFLGLKTLSVLARCIDLIRTGRGITVDLANLPLNDPPTFAMLSRGDTTGVFQLESAGMRDTLRKLKPDSFEDIIAVVALYRPGPMDNIPSYIRRKHGEEVPDYLHPSLEGILCETYGIMIYQEQVMQIAQTLAGYSLGRADLLRRAMGKKIKEEMDKQREAFVAGALARGVAEAKASHIFDLVAKFAGYGFNKSHAAAYALVAYQTAYLKANYPVEFFAAAMSFELNHADKLGGFRQELSRLGITLLPPDVNASDVAFSVEADPTDPAGSRKAVRYALAAIRNVGEGAAAALVAERRRGGPFRHLADFASRLDGHTVGKRPLEMLVKAGALDCLNANRRQLFEAVEMLVRVAHAAEAERTSGQMALFGTSAAAGVSVPLPVVEDWPPMDRLKAELEAIGFYLSAHPLDAFGARLSRLGVVPFSDVLAQRQGGPVTLAGTVIGKRERTSGKGNRYAFVQLSDTSGVYEVTVFSEVLATRRDVLVPGVSLLVRASFQIDGETVRCTAQEIEPLDAAISRLGTTVEIAIDGADPLPAIARTLAAAPGGRGTVRLLAWLGGGEEAEIALPLRATLTPEVLHRLRSIAGVRDIREV
jgi:DNA polymerase-3 subunit alpha